MQSDGKEKKDVKTKYTREELKELGIYVKKKKKKDPEE